MLAKRTQDEEANEMPLNAPSMLSFSPPPVGSRLRLLTDLNSKPLAQIHGTAILHNALHNIIYQGSPCSAGYQRSAA